MRQLHVDSLDVFTSEIHYVLDMGQDYFDENRVMNEGRVLSLDFHEDRAITKLKSCLPLIGNEIPLTISGLDRSVRPPDTPSWVPETGGSCVVSYVSMGPVSLRGMDDAEESVACHLARVDTVRNSAGEALNLANFPEGISYVGENWYRRPGRLIARDADVTETRESGLVKVIAHPQTGTVGTAFEFSVNIGEYVADNLERIPGQVKSALIIYSGVPRARWEAGLGDEQQASSILTRSWALTRRMLRRAWGSGEGAEESMDQEEDAEQSMVEGDDAVSETQ